ncbi:MAG TPA: nucleotidyltransferase [Elusimicrobia bacterium]|nr:nucleotidyltransferase [Elusimicrobiota bacterium]
MKTFKEIKDIIQTHKDELRQKYKVKKIGIFGSYVRGIQTSKSDVDILVSFNETISLLKLAGLEMYLEDILGIKTEVVPKEDIRRELKNNILQSVVYL